VSTYDVERRSFTDLTVTDLTVDAGRENGFGYTPENGFAGG
jgi:hypothetical protein